MFYFYVSKSLTINSISPAFYYGPAPGIPLVTTSLSADLLKYERIFFKVCFEKLPSLIYGGNIPVTDGDSQFSSFPGCILNFMCSQNAKPVLGLCSKVLINSQNSFVQLPSMQWFLNGGVIPASAAIFSQNKVTVTSLN